MKIVTLSNSFHRTEVHVRVPESWEDTWMEIQCAANDERSRQTRGPWRRKLERINSTLCGISDCKCGTVR